MSQLKQLLVCKSGVREVGWAAVSRMSDPVLSYLTWFDLVCLVLLRKSLEFRKGSTSGVTSSRCRQSEEGDADIGAVHIHNMYYIYVYVYVYVYVLHIITQKLQTMLKLHKCGYRHGRFL